MSYDKIAECYDSIFTDWVHVKDVYKKRFQEYFSDYLSKPVNRVLDCACGTGLQTIALLESEIETFSIDISEKMLEKAKAHAAECSLPFEGIVEDIRYLTSIENERFDAAVCMGTSIPHISLDDFNLMLINLRTKLKNNGLFIFEYRDLYTYLLNRSLTIPITKKQEHGIQVEYYYKIEKRTNELVHLKLKRRNNSEVTSIDKSIGEITYFVYPENQYAHALQINNFKVLNVEKRPGWICFICVSD